jgi:predicted DNA-binding transcriptional regulator YafY
MKLIEAASEIEFDYVNWKGIKSRRQVLVMSIWFGSNEWCKEEQWILKGCDLDENETRMFAMRDMSNVVRLV